MVRRNGAALDPADLFGDEGSRASGPTTAPPSRRPSIESARLGGSWSSTRYPGSPDRSGTPSAIAERLDKAGADLVSLSEKIDTTSATGKMVFRLLAVLAEFERDLVSERTRAGSPTSGPGASGPGRSPMARARPGREDVGRPPGRG